MNLDSLISDANQFVGAYLIPFGWKLLGAIGVWIVTASKVMKPSTQTASVGGGLRHWAESPGRGPAWLGRKSRRHAAVPQARAWIRCFLTDIERTPRVYLYQ